MIYNSQPASKFTGEGVKIRRVTVEGPLESSWPPQRTRKLFPGVQWKASKDKQRGRAYEPVLTESPIEHVRAIVSALAPRAFRRKVSNHEIDALVALAKPSLEAKRDFVDSVRIPLRAILVSPELLFLTNATATRSESRQDLRRRKDGEAESLDDFRYERLCAKSTRKLANQRFSGHFGLEK